MPSIRSLLFKQQGFSHRFSTTDIQSCELCLFLIMQFGANIAHNTQVKKNNPASRVIYFVTAFIKLVFCVLFIFLLFIRMPACPT